MIKNSAAHHCQKFLVALFFGVFLVTSTIAPENNALADNAMDRFRQCTPAADPNSSNTKDVEIEGISSLFGDDLEVDVNNTYCATSIMVHYISFKLRMAAMNKFCGSGSVVPRTIPSPAQDLLEIGKATKKAFANPGPCRVAYASVWSQWVEIMTHLGAIRETSRSAFENARICGSNWMKYSPKTMMKDVDGYKKIAQDAIDAAVKEGLSRPVTPLDTRVYFAKELNFNDNINTYSNVADQETAKKIKKYYRELYYGGVEREYPGCKDVNRGTIGNYPPQRYYFRGSEAGIYNCENYNPKNGWNDPLIEKTEANRSISAARKLDYQTAYECCLDKQKSSICIEYNASGVNFHGIPTGEIGKATGLTSITDQSDGSADGYKYKLCKAGTRCNISGIEFEAKSKFNTMVCASSYSLCPYNFNIGGGSIACDYFEDSQDGKSPSEKDVKDKKCSGLSEIRNSDCQFNAKSGKCRNYCQPLNHCVVVDSSGYTYNSQISSPYFSEACINFIGDSKNSVNYDTGLLAGQQIHFSLPIAQCVKETVANVFFNIAGHTKCTDPSLFADSNGNCSDGKYIFKKGEQVANGNFFSKIQSNLRNLFQLLLIISIMVSGYKVMGGNFGVISGKALRGYIIKIALISYFVMSNAWQTYFFNAVYTVADTFSAIVMNVSVPDSDEKRDGCQFGWVKDSNNNKIAATSPYPKGKEYLSIWDTMDCKIGRYLGMGSNLSAPNIAKLIAASIFTGSYGIWFAIFLSIFGILIISVTVSMLHIFLTSAISIVILVYASLITIPTLLFEKTKNIFDKWLSNLISLSLQPIILFAYVGIFLSVFDYVILGSATYRGDAPNKTLVCDDRCVDNLSGAVIEVPSGKSMEEVCDISKGYNIISPKSDSIACIIDTKNVVGNWPGLEFIGIGIPVLKDVFSNSGRKKIGVQIITILKASALIYILFAFIVQIPDISSALIGGSSIKISSINPMDVIKGVGGAATGIASRARRGGAKWGKKAGDSAAGSVKRGANSAGNQGKSTSTAEGSSGSANDNADA